MIYIVIVINRMDLSISTKWFSNEKEALEYRNKIIEADQKEYWGYDPHIHEIPWKRTKSEFIKNANLWGCC